MHPLLWSPGFSQQASSVLLAERLALSHRQRSRKPSAAGCRKAHETLLPAGSSVAVIGSGEENIFCNKISEGMHWSSDHHQCMMCRYQTTCRIALLLVLVRANTDIDKLMNTEVVLKC